MRAGYSNVPVSETSVQTSKGGLLTVLPEGGYQYQYGRRNLYTLACAIFASIGGLSFGYDQGVIANVLVMPAFKAQFAMSAFHTGLITAVLELGALVGSLAAGVLANGGRRQAIFISTIVFLTGSALQTVATSLFMLGLGRFIGGIGVGALSMLSPLYISEISPPSIRGALLSLEQLSIVFGVVVGFWLGFFTRNIEGPASWRIPLGLQMLPGLLLLVGCIALPASPRLHVLKGDIDGAEKVLMRLRSQEEELVQLELLEMRSEAVFLLRSARSRSPWISLFDKRYISRTLIGVFVMVFQQWSGINALLYYAPTLVLSAGVQGDVAPLIVSGFIDIVQLLAVIPAILYIDTVGRKSLLRGGSAVMCMSHLMVALLISTFSDSWKDHTETTWICVGFLYIFTAAYGLSFGPIGWVLPNEVFPLSMRSEGASISIAANWINNFIVGLITPPLMEKSPPATFAIFSLACAAAYLWSTHVVPETAGRSLEDMDAIFHTQDNKDSLSLRQEIEQELGIQDYIQHLIGT